MRLLFLLLPSFWLLFLLLLLLVELEPLLSPHAGCSLALGPAS
jgi:hypothetical protein